MLLLQEEEVEEEKAVCYTAVSSPQLQVFLQICFLHFPRGNDNWMFEHKGIVIGMSAEKWMKYLMMTDFLFLFRTMIIRQ